MGVPSVYLWDCNSAGTIVNKFMLLADDHSVRWLDECRGFKNDNYPSPIIEEDSYGNGDLHIPKMSSIPSFKVVKKNTLIIRLNFAKQFYRKAYN